MTRTSAHDPRVGRRPHPRRVTGLGGIDDASVEHMVQNVRPVRGGPERSRSDRP